VSHTHAPLVHHSVEVSHKEERKGGDHRGDDEEEDSEDLLRKAANASKDLALNEHYSPQKHESP